MIGLPMYQTDNDREVMLYNLRVENEKLRWELKLLKIELEKARASAEPKPGL